MAYADGSASPRSQHASNNGNGGNNNDEGDDGGGGQGREKRRRITQSCNMCRKKRIKCDGKVIGLVASSIAFPSGPNR
jgi:hypothetical protein